MFPNFFKCPFIKPYQWVDENFINIIICVTKLVKRKVTGIQIGFTSNIVLNVFLTKVANQLATGQHLMGIPGVPEQS